MRTLSANTQSEVSQPVTQPGYLVEIFFSVANRLSTRGDITWNGYTWVSSDVRITGLSWDGSADQKGTLQLGNTDNAFGSLVLNEGVADRAINIYQFYGAAPAAGDPVFVFSGVGDAAEIYPDKVSITLTSAASKTLASPRNFITKANGFNHLPAAGVHIPWNGEMYRLERNG